MADLESARFPIVNQVTVDATPERIFEVFEDAESWPQWVESIVNVKWTSPKPFRAGTTRIVTLKGVAADETFITWDPGKRMTFYFNATSVPFAKCFCEDYWLENAGNGQTVVHHTVVFEPNLLTFFMGPILRSSMRKMFKVALQSLSDYLKKHPKQNSL